MKNKHNTIRSGYVFFETFFVVFVIVVLMWVVINALLPTVAKAREVSYIATISSLGKLVEASIASGDMQQIPESTNWSCLGDYTTRDLPCWHDVRNARGIDSVLEDSGQLPGGAYSPYPSGAYSPYGFAGAIMKKTEQYVEIHVYAGKGKVEMCHRMGLRNVSVENDSSCVARYFFKETIGK